MSRRIDIVEVGPRDGLQNEKTLFTVGQKLEMIRRLETAGARRMEVVSFVNPKRVPQMDGAEEIMFALPRTPGRSRIGLVLNMRGWDRCVEARCDEANVVVCASDEFGIRNQGANVAEQVDALGAIVAARKADDPPISATVSVAFGCPFEGEVPEERVVSIVKAAAGFGVAEIALADTIGVADPWMVRRRVELAKAAAGGIPLRLHFHDTRNTGLANAFAGVEAGVDVLDASVGGLGGCPFAPNATGNIGTEDLVYMLERAGFETGYDLDQLIEIGNWASDLLGKRTASSLSRAGGFPKAKVAV
ncbi:MAG: hydroxymethylglutaryl-CoA lyase [Alphaproteobacteria bacterium]|nr:hydroxymethylglutaryl-CoA lyase [Alphaproteobacteria bacterium]MBU1514586.1 hydroxymethylglutaryl-CoA lyase [Alphaproteobacteria bacterium]MBU2096782.1 hydroxymethylglutaryl-CoA lyase [Alphaproteobacteria bacterium]MBU2152494.1 hydroxymethylglutaryl-CoA lyase [Alphaproteobacteria bacterium]MBU2306585.1 hydroxymethylglutaryl-CoA lyase [Alphaproteobacteria bacterium]